MGRRRVQLVKKRCRERETVRERERDGWRGENKRQTQTERERERMKERSWGSCGNRRQTAVSDSVLIRQPTLPDKLPPASHTELPRLLKGGRGSQTDRQGLSAHRPRL